MSLQIGDTLFTREGRPVQIKEKDPQTGKVVLERDVDTISTNNKEGLKNKLHPALKEAYDIKLSESKNVDKKEEINNLNKKIEELKNQKAPKDLIRYLESELKHRMTREQYQPSDYGIDPFTLGGSHG